MQLKKDGINMLSYFFAKRGRGFNAYEAKKSCVTVTYYGCMMVEVMLML